jgi:hypothetical protein
MIFLSSNPEGKMAAAVLLVIIMSIISAFKGKKSNIK